MERGDFGDFLVARRASVRPADVGLPSYGYRRVPGLRREEVAALAGVNTYYYARLEQGRERHPSQQVLDALSRALALTGDAREHLYRLTGLLPLSRARDVVMVEPGLRQLMDAWPATPAYVLNCTMDVLAENDLASALHSGFRSPDNLVRMAFLDPAGRDFYVDWVRAAHASVANLRVAAGYDPHAPRLCELLAELTARSPEFRGLWERHEVYAKSHEPKEFHHPEVGRLTLSMHTFDVRGAAGQQLVVYRAEAGSASEQALSLLGAIAATRRAEKPCDV